MADPSPLPDVTPPLTPSGYRPIRAWPWLLLSLLVLLASCVIGVPVALVYATATAADHGAACPACAALEWENDLGTPWRDADGEIRVEKILVPARRAALLRQRADYLALMQADSANQGPGNSDFADADPARDQQTITGDRAILVRSIGIRWHYIDPNDRLGHIGGAIEATPWTYDIRRDSKGWRIWSVIMPAWCEAYSSCGHHPPPSTSPSPSPTDDDLGRGDLASRLPCGPLDPLRSLRACPSSIN